MAIVGIIGNLGSGKTILLTCALIDDLERGRQCFANYHISYKSDDGRLIHTVDTGRLVEWLANAEKHRFPLGGASLGLDEIYIDMDSRASQAMSSRLLSHFVFQCIEANTLVKTRTGDVPIKKIKVGDDILSTFGFQTVKVVNHKKVYGLINIKLENGVIIRCTPEHKFLTRKAKLTSRSPKVHDVEASHLNYTRTSIVYESALDDKITSLDDYSILLGVIAAEGHFTKYKVELSFDSREIDLHNFVIKTLTKYYPDIKLDISSPSEFGMTIEFGKQNIVKDLHDRLYIIYQNKQSDLVAASFLRGFYEGDGTINSTCIQFTQSDSNKHKRDKALEFLTQLGINYSSCIIRKGYPQQAQIVSISNKKMKRIFDLKIGFLSQSKRDRLKQILFRTQYKASELLHEVKVKKITREVGIFEVYDIELEYNTYPYYFANGVLVHNSRKLGLDLYFTGQLASSIDKRLKNLTDIWVVAEKVIEPVLDWEGKQTGIIEKFNYAQLDRDEKLTEFSILPENAKNIFPYYSTSEIVDPSQMTVDKSETKRIVKSMGKAVSGRKPKSRSEYENVDEDG